MEYRNNLYDKALDFGKEIVLLYRDTIANKIEIEICKQFLRSGTSVGANIAEAQGSVSESDYISKIHTAYKELLETKFWIELLEKTGSINFENKDLFTERINELSKILYTIIKNIRQKRK